MVDKNDITLINSITCVIPIKPERQTKHNPNKHTNQWTNINKHVQFVVSCHRYLPSQFSQGHT